MRMHRQIPSVESRRHLIVNVWLQHVGTSESHLVLFEIESAESLVSLTRVRDGGSYLQVPRGTRGSKEGQLKFSPVSLSHV